MQVNLEFEIPDPDSIDAMIRGLCIENEMQNNVKSCFGIAWRNDQSWLSAGYFYKNYLQ